MTSSFKLGVFIALLVTEVFGRYISEEINYDNISNSHVVGELQEDCNCDWRYYRHYEAKGCQMVQTNSCGCPLNYSCSLTKHSYSELKVCVYQNLEYKVGAKIKLADKCQTCRCADGITPHITCRHRECPQLDPVEGENCHLIYEENKCCPSRYECVTETAENAAEAEGFTCVYNNATYPIGAKIYPLSDPCLICECNKNWNGISNSSCYQQECVFEKNKHLLDIGCIPVYHERKCCPIEYYCPDSLRLKNVEMNSTELSSENSTESSEFCNFSGNSYKNGMELPLNNSCVKCTCQVPPDFTCIHQTCPLPPKAENCDAFYVADQCCPDYDCLLADSEANDKENITATETICPTPLCADSSCRIGVLPGHECPTCICGDSREKNVFEPLEQIFEHEYVEVNNETLNVLNDTESPSKPDNASEKEPLSQIFMEQLSNNTFNEEFEGIQPRMQNPEIALQTNENSDAGDTEYFLQLPSDGSPGVEETENVIPSDHRPRRSENMQSNGAQSAASQQQQWTVLQQGVDPLETSESSEIEREYSEENNEGFDELKVFGSSSSNTEIIILDERDFNNVEWVTTVPGCPTPLCENSSCRIGVPHGQRCPTCICQSRRQP